MFIKIDENLLNDMQMQGLYYVQYLTDELMLDIGKEVK